MVEIDGTEILIGRKRIAAYTGFSTARIDTLVDRGELLVWRVEPQRTLVATKNMILRSIEENAAQQRKSRK